MFSADLIEASIIPAANAESFAVGEVMRGRLVITVPEELAIDDLRLKINGESIRLSGELLLKAGINDFPFTTTLSLRAPKTLPQTVVFTQKAQFLLQPSRSKNKLKGRKFGRVFKPNSGKKHQLGLLFSARSVNTRFEVEETVFEPRTKIDDSVIAALVVISALLCFALPVMFLPLVMAWLIYEERKLAFERIFRHLDLRVLRTEEGVAYLELAPGTVLETFLDGSLLLTVSDWSAKGWGAKRKVLFREVVALRDEASLHGSRYLVPLPVPPVETTLSAGPNALMVWKLELRYPRGFLKDLVVSQNLTVSLARRQGLRLKNITPEPAAKEFAYRRR